MQDFVMSTYYRMVPSKVINDVFLICIIAVGFYGPALQCKNPISQREELIPSIAHETKYAITNSVEIEEQYEVKLLSSPPVHGKKQRDFIFIPTHTSPAYASPSHAAVHCVNYEFVLPLRV